MKQAVCVLIPLSKFTFVSISRRGNNTMWGIPGGKVDEGETNIQAALREIKEEIGVELNPTHLIPLYSGVCVGEVTYWVTTYLYDNVDIKMEMLKAEDGMELAAKTAGELCNYRNSPFSNYNEEVFSALFDLSE